MAIVGSYKKLADGSIEPKAGAVFQKAGKDYVAVRTENKEVRVLRANINFEKGSFTYRLVSIAIDDSGVSRRWNLAKKALR